MSETPSQPCATPARRRQGRNPGRSGAQKAYASENDVSNLDPSRYDGIPSTPRRDYDSPGPQGTQNASNQRSRKQPRPKNNNQPTSPESGRPGRQTPPQTATKPGNLPAFAGATFHASPAPSALPLPSFLSRTSTESPSLKATNDVAQEPSPPTDTEAPTPSHPSSGPVSQESPLDFMFRAHRQEVERKRRESSTGSRPSVPNTASALSYSPFEPRSLPKPSNLPQNNRPQTQPRYRPSGIASDELDGNPGQPILPAFATPYQERMKAARSNSNRAAPVQQASQQPTNAPTADPTEALKKYLFSRQGPSEPKSVPNSYPSGHYSPAQLSNTPTAAPMPNGSQENRPNNIRAMEDDLRRILKLDQTPSRTGHEQRLFS